MNKKVLLMVAHHKNDPFLNISKKFFFPIQVGKAINDIELNIQGDDEGDNISIKNKSFCELTAYYYAWQNMNYEYIGLMHYRRIFTNKYFLIDQVIEKIKYYIKHVLNCFYFKRLDLFFSTVVTINNKDKLISMSKDLNKFLESNLDKYDIVVPKKRTFRYLNMEEQFSLKHCTNDWIIFEKIVQDKYPYLEKSFNIVKKQKSFYTFNMFIMKNDLYKNYMKILFDILFTMEKKVELIERTPYQTRLYGFLSERFLNVYIHYLLNKNIGIKIKELNCVFIDLDE